VTYRVEVSRSALKELAALPGDVSERLAARIGSLSCDPLPQGAQRLRGAFEGLYRVRVGDYRVIYNVEQATGVVAVVRVGHRHNVYR
jgi:mRNA interferase RelE/StbE